MRGCHAVAHTAINSVFYWPHTRMLSRLQFAYSIVVTMFILPIYNEGVSNNKNAPPNTKGVHQFFLSSQSYHPALTVCIALVFTPLLTFQPLTALCTLVTSLTNDSILLSSTLLQALCSVVAAPITLSLVLTTNAQWCASLVAAILLLMSLRCR